MSLSYQNNYTKYLPFLLLVPIYIIGMFMDVLDIDEAQYASMARQMLESGHWLQIIDRTDNYLDKPPLLFWLAAISYKLLGVSSFAYRAPSFLATIVGVYSTFRFARLYYSYEKAYLAALLLASTEAYFLFNHDVRTDTLLTNCVIVSLWQLAAFIEQKRIYHLVLGFLFIGLSMLSKGMLGLVIPIMAFSVHFILKRDWKQFIRWEWLLGLLIIGVVLTPMSIGLYQQFGLKGLRFFYWTQSFGRITGESSWDNHPDTFFLYHTFLWAFLPWSLFCIVALFYQVRDFIRQKIKITNEQEAITLGGFILPFIALSTSHYQLNHYIYVVFPVAAIITANYIVNKIRLFDYGQKSPWLYIQGFIIIALWVLGILLITKIFPLHNLLIWLVFVLISVGSLYLLFFSKNLNNKIINSSVLAIAGINYIINIHIYPYLLKNYQSEMLAAQYVQQQELIDKNNFYWYNEFMPSMDFYSKRIVMGVDKNTFENFASGNYFIYTNQKGKNDIMNWQGKTEVLKEYNHFHVSTLSPEFINPNTRLSQTEKRYLIKIIK